MFPPHFYVGLPIFQSFSMFYYTKKPAMKQPYSIFACQNLPVIFFKDFLYDFLINLLSLF